MRPQARLPTERIAFAAANCRFVQKHPNGIEEFWLADIKAVRRGVFDRIFQDVIFVERPGELAWLYGVGTPDEMGELRRSPETVSQVEFLEFLAADSARYIAAVYRFPGLIPRLRYEALAKATAAYLTARTVEHAFLVGFAGGQGRYELIDINLWKASAFERTIYCPLSEFGS